LISALHLARHRAENSPRISGQSVWLDNELGPAQIRGVGNITNMHIILSKLLEVVAVIFGFVLMYFAGWLLGLAGLDHGRWQSLIAFFPAVVLIVGGSILLLWKRHAGVMILVGVLFFTFGMVILIGG
jgi:hypothetical protein